MDTQYLNILVYNVYRGTVLAMVWGYLKDINRHTILVASPVNTTRGKGGS